MYSKLKLNGESYTRKELLALADSKLKESKINLWEEAIYHFMAEWLDENEHVVVQTSGSTGNPKLLSIEKTRMIASAKATNSFFNLNENKSALLCLSAEYIAGKMMLVRAFVGGFDLQYTEPKSDALLKIKSDIDFVAVVPLQLELALKSGDKQVLGQIKKMIVGGASLRHDLIAQLETLNTEIWQTYGMTETITHIALQKLNGRSKTDYFQALQDVEFSCDERSCLLINAPAVSLDPVQTNDRVELINQNQFRFLGRIDFVINSGGIKFSPEILEQKLASSIENDFSFSSKTDRVLGERLVLVIEGNAFSEEKFTELNTTLKKVLTRFEQPKEILFIRQLPKTENGKLDRIRLKEMI